MATAVLPAGMESIFITGTTQAAHKVRTGEDLTEEHPYGFVSRQALLDEIQFKGAISDFHALKDKLKKYSAEQVLFVWDVEEVYGNNFLIAVTESARDAQLDAYRAAQAAAAAAAAAAASAADARDGAPDEADAAVTSKPWESRGSEKEVEAATVSSHRPYLLLAVSRARSEFGLGFKLADRDAHDGFVECRPFKDPNFELRRATRSAGTQEVAPLADARTQTEWFRPLNKATQAEPQPLDPRALAAVVSSAELRRFLAGARVLLEGALQQNELVDIYGDDLALLAEDDASVGNRSDNDVRELQSFSRSSYSHERVVTASHWKPGSAGIVGVSLARKHGFEERVEVAGRVHVGHVLIWSFADPITPLFALEAPQDVLTFVFNPHTPNLVLAGVTSGQLVLWDLDDKPLPTVGGGGASGSTGAAASGSGNGAGGANAGGGAAAGADGDEGSGNGGENQTVHLAPCGVSAIEHSHHRAITAIAWLPLRHEVTPGARLKQDDGGGSAWQSWQCATTACDGYVCFWDVRLARKETAASASRVGERERRRDPDDKAAWDAVEAAIKKDEWLWVPVCRILLHKLDASTELGCAYLELCGVPHGSKLYAATDEGELAMVEIAHVPAAGAPPEADNADFTGVKSVLHGHVGPAVALQRSPFFRDIYLTVGDWSSHVWKEGVSAPIFSSPYTPERLTAGCWSPSRAAVIFLAKADGSVDVWDLADRTHEPSTSFNVVGGAAVTSLDMFAQQSTQLLAAGDDQGTLHIMEIPRNMRRAPATEKAAMAAFIAREELRVAYVQSHAEQRDAGAADAAGGDKAAADAAAAILAAAADAGSAADEDGFDAKAEEEYRALEIAFKTELGLLAAEEGDQEQRHE